MKTTIEINTEDTFEMTNLMNIIGNYLEKKKIDFNCMGYMKQENGKQLSLVRVGEK